MADEAVLLREVALPVSFTVLDTPGIEKGSVMKLSDPNSASISNENYDEIAGIAAQEKIDENGQTKLAIYDKGDFAMLASGNIGVGDPVGSAATTSPNAVLTLVGVANLSGNCCLGISKEDAGDGHIFRVELKPQALVSA